MNPQFPPVCSQARVSPSCGRLVGFSSGPVNPHGVTAVTGGRRCALALWFTKEKPYRDMVSVLISLTLLARAGVSAGFCRDSRGYHERLDCDANVVASSHAEAFTFPSPPSFSGGLPASSHVCLVNVQNPPRDRSPCDVSLITFWRKRGGSNAKKEMRKGHELVKVILIFLFKICSHFSLFLSLAALALKSS